MAATATYKCARCGNPFTARTADRNRGWARFCSKSCKAAKQSASKPRQRHDGVSPMKWKVCDTCGDAAVNGVRHEDGVEWFCENHRYEATLHPFDSDALGQW